MVVSFGMQFAWPEAQQPLSVGVVSINRHADVHAAAIADVVSCHTSSARFLLHESQAKTLMCASGHGGEFLWFGTTTP